MAGRRLARLFQFSRFVLFVPGLTGAFIDHFTAQPSGGEAMRWRRGFMYASSHTSDEVLRFNGRTGVLMGPVTEGFLDWATGFDFGPDGNVYVASFSTTA
jgi:hypothetical protein